MNNSNKLSIPVMIVAVVILIVFGVMTYLLYGMVATQNEMQWTRLIYLYGGIEAIAFAAAGYLFGREVHRQQAQSAEKRADQKDREAADVQAKGNRLAGAIIGKAESGLPVRGELNLLSDDERKGHDDIQSLAALARELFPAGRSERHA